VKDVVVHLEVVQKLDVDDLSVFLALNRGWFKEFFNGTLGEEETERDLFLAFAAVVIVGAGPLGVLLCRHSSNVKRLLVVNR
jgi:hypothetical protein